jgi:HD-like signal output (HDOD) protein
MKNQIEEEKIKKRIIFVDDEPTILRMNRRMFQNRQDAWDMEFVEEGTAACRAFESAPFDVIVTDMRMPNMDGAELLGWVQENSPQTVRIVVSGFAETEAILRSLPVAHQFLSKPFEAKVLASTIERACDLQKLLQNDSLRELLAGLRSLPAMPELYQKLTAELADPNSSLSDAAALVEQDPGLSAKVLQLVNSAFFGVPQRISNVRSAVTYIGSNMLKSLVLTVEVFRGLDSLGQRIGPFSIDALHRHSLTTANIARLLLRERQPSEDAFIAGILHDIGLLILAGEKSELFGEVMDLHRTEDLILVEAETSILGVNHAEVIAYLLGVWGLPYPIVDAVARHHRPDSVADPCFDVVTATYIADALAEEAGAGLGCDSPIDAPLDEEFLKTIGVADDLPAWRELALDQAEVVRGQW